MRQLHPDSDAEPIADNAAAAPETAAGKRPHPLHPDRWSDGTVRAGFSGPALKHGAFSQHRSAEQARALAALELFRAELETQQGGRDELTTIRAGYIERLTEAEALCRLLGADLRQRGIFTQKGRIRPTFGAFLAAVERWDRLAQRLGMERRAKDANQLDSCIHEYIAATTQHTQEGVAHAEEQATATRTDD